MGYLASRTHTSVETEFLFSRKLPFFFFGLGNAVFSSVSGQEAFRIFNFWKASLASGTVFCLIKLFRNCISFKQSVGALRYPVSPRPSKGPSPSAHTFPHPICQRPKPKHVPGKAREEGARQGERCLIITQPLKRTSSKSTLSKTHPAFNI